MCRKLEKVLVKNIAEFPVTLGGNCTLLDAHDMHVYRNTSEEIQEFLDTTAKDPKYIDICISEPRCRNILAGLKAHAAFDDDPITFSEYNGTYWVGEGKHRVCMALRAGIDWVWGKVNHLSDINAEHYLLLPPIGCGDTIVADAEASETTDHFNSNELVLLLKVPIYVMGCEERRIIRISNLPSTGGWSLVVKGIKGIYYKKEKAEVQIPRIPKLPFLNWHRTIRVTKTSVKIEPHHTKTQVWLKRIPLENGILLISEAEELYRYGRWKKSHLKILDPLDVTHRLTWRR